MGLADDELILIVVVGRVVVPAVAPGAGSTGRSGVSFLGSSGRRRWGQVGAGRAWMSPIMKFPRSEEVSLT
jgi:hypothetical protein